MKKTRVLVVDDSALMRRLLTDLLNSDDGIEVVGAAPDAYVAREKIKALDPDVLTLDIEMPRMDGVTFLSNLMRLRPMPVVMVSTLAESGADLTLRALELGAVDFVTKPKTDLVHTLSDYAEEISRKVKSAAATNISALVRRNESSQVAIKPVNGSAPHSFRTTDKLIAIGASTGGTEAIREVLTRLPADSAGIVIVQHIPPVFSQSFANRMNEVCALSVCEARDGQRVMPGHAYIAPGDRHLSIVRDGATYRCCLHDSEPVNRHKPAVDVLFDSVAEFAGENAVGVILTGMGRDGAKGLLRMRERGARTVAQDESSSVVWGMPGAAVKEGAAETVLPLETIAAKAASLSRSE